MGNDRRWPSITPSGWLVESVEVDEGVMVVSARSVADRWQCPRCGRSSGRVHSRYVVTIADLPCADTDTHMGLSQSVRLRLSVAADGRPIFADLPS